MNTDSIQQETNHALREVRKLMNVLSRYGNCLVPSLDGKPTYAMDRLSYYFNKLQMAGLSMDDIDRQITLFSKVKPLL